MEDNSIAAKSKVIENPKVSTTEQNGRKQRSIKGAWRPNERREERRPEKEGRKARKMKRRKG